MDIQFWIWLAIIAISFIARALKKNPTDSVDPQKPINHEPLGPVSFEELLKEIQASKTSKPKTPPVTTKPIEEADNREVVVQEQTKRESLRPAYIPYEHTNEVYEKAKAAAFNRPSLEETLKLEDTIVRFDRFKGYKDDSTARLEYLQNLFDREKLKQAFILNEVLMRKF